MPLKLLIGFAVSLSLLAGAAAAQGSFSPNRKPTGWEAPSGRAKAPTSPYAPQATPYIPAKPKTYGPPAMATPPAFKPYEPWKPGASTTSLFGPDGKKKR